MFGCLLKSVNKPWKSRVPWCNRVDEDEDKGDDDNNNNDDDAFDCNVNDDFDCNIDDVKNDENRDGILL